jgi:hypothetical protein
MLENQNRILVVGLTASVISGGLVIYAFSKAIGKDEFKPIVSVTTLRLGKPENAKSDSIPRPLVVSTIPGTNISWSKPRSQPSSVAKTQPKVEQVWDSKEKDSILNGIKVLRVADQKVTIIDNNTTYELKINDYLPSAALQLTKIDQSTREIVFNISGKQVTTYY